MAKMDLGQLQQKLMAVLDGAEREGLLQLPLKQVLDGIEVTAVSLTEEDRKNRVMRVNVTLPGMVTPVVLDDNEDSEDNNNDDS